MKLRRTLALLGPLTAVAALKLPWYSYEDFMGGHAVTFSVRGWDLLTGMNFLVLAIVAAMAWPVARGRAPLARSAAVAGGAALALIALRSLFVPWENTASSVAGLEAGPWVMLAAAAAAILAGRSLHARENDVATVRRILALIGPVGAVAALSLPWWMYLNVEPLPFPGADPGPWVERGWDDLGGLELALIGFGAAAAAAALGARRAHARAVCVACGVVVAGLAAWSLIFQVEFEWSETIPQVGPVAALAAGVVTAVAGYVLYAPRRSASSLITAS